MNKIFKKAIAGFTALALVATLLVGIGVSKEVKADVTTLAASTWTFAQGGMYNPNEPGNEGYINSVTMAGTNEVISGWLRGNKAGDADPSVNQTQTSTSAATGFTIGIDNTGWDAQWSAVTGFPTNRINPWAIQATTATAIEGGQDLTVSFTIQASKKKFGYVTFGSDIEGTAPYGEAGLTGDSQLIVITTTPQTYTYTFTNWATAAQLKTTIQLGAFDAQYDYAGNDISNIITDVENGWNGTVYVTDFKVTTTGVNPGYVAPPPRPTTPQQTEAPTVAPTQPQTQAPTVAPTQPVKPSVVAKKLGKVKKVTAKNIKKGTVKITWKKVKNAKKYQVKVGKKTYKTKKVKLTVKKLKKGKKYTIKVRAMKRTGYKAGAWSKAVKVKIKK